MRILLVEDEAQLRTQVQAQLQASGYTVDVSGDGKEGLFFASEYPLDAAIVDLGLPGISGIELIKRLRALGKTLPILILTARGSWQDKVAGLEAGADDYLVKPFQMEELQARVKALLRRAHGATQETQRYGPLQINLQAQSITVRDLAIELTAYEYRLLEYLIRQRGKIVTKQELADYLYPHDMDIETAMCWKF